MRLRPARAVENAWALASDEVAGELGVIPSEGLGSDEASDRLRRHGGNTLREHERESALEILLRQFKSLIIIILGAAALASFAFGEVTQAIAILVALLINAAIGFFTEYRAIRSMEALRQLGRVEVRVRRGGGISEVSAEEIVPGDVVLFEAGDIVTADVRLVEASRLQADEAALTGESVPVDKTAEQVSGDTPLAERSCMLWKGTAVTKGSGEGVVVGTGEATELGRVASLVREAEEEVTPLEKRLAVFGRRLIWVTLGIAVVVAGAGALAGRDLVTMVETSVALAVAAIPEGLPIVATVALARGMWRMASRNAVLNRLASVETLGATTVIFSDKTGTLTENRMVVREYGTAGGSYTLTERGTFERGGETVSPEEEPALSEALRIGVLVNNASLGQREGVGHESGAGGSESANDAGAGGSESANDAGAGGSESVSDSGAGASGDPLEIALLTAGAAAGLGRDRLLEELPEEREEAFDPEVAMMATFHRNERGYLVAVKGAPEAVIERCGRELADGEERGINGTRERWVEKAKAMAEEGLRVLALARGEAEDVDQDPYEDLTLVALVGLYDPPHEAASAAIERCRSAGIDVLMVTGDLPETARRIAYAVDLTDREDAPVVRGSELEDLEGEDSSEAPIYARVSPEQKLKLISEKQDEGHVVAMTGDGANDAPALRKADIGIAMGRRGTQVAREAADMVLKDDELSTIVEAVAQGRVIFGNIRKFVLYLLPCHVGEIVAVTVASLAGAPIPILPLQILYLNIVTDVFPALALGVGEGDPAVMSHPPRDPDEPILTRGHWYAVGGYGLAIAVPVLWALWLLLDRMGYDRPQAVSASFLTLGFASLWHVFNVRDRRSGVFVNDVTRNPFVWGAVAICVALLLVAVYVPGLAEILRVERPEQGDWLIIIGLSLVPWAGVQLVKWLSVLGRESRSES
ncbi:MAG: HAD-IC family P-type ATPase [Candidatus Eisenbacteria bacterium]|nr:HAD-IC family P-type ATPase [Candidatus Eisenbacteria bacterium]